MAFDGLFTHFLIHELHSQLPQRIQKIQQADHEHLIFTVKGQQKKQKLLISTHPMYARLHMTTSSFDIPFDPPMFTKVLRKHIEGGMIHEINQIGNDRLIQFVIESRNDLGDLTTYHVYVEVMGKHSNIILTTKEDKIIDSIKHLTPNTNKARTIMPGFTYDTPATQNKINPFDVDTPVKYIDLNQGRLDKQVMQSFEGLSPMSAKLMLSQSRFVTGDNFNQLFKQFMSICQDPQPTLWTSNNKEFFYITHPNIQSEASTYFTPFEDVKTYDTISELCDAFYKDRANKAKIDQQAKDLLKTIEQTKSRLKSKLEKLNIEYNEAINMDEYQLKGELLTTYMHQLNNHSDQVEVINYYTNEPIIIDIDTTKSINDNAQKYYAKYQKLKRRQKEVTAQIKQTKEDLQYIDSLHQSMQTIDLQDIDDVREEMINAGFLKKNKSKQQHKQKNKKSHENYITTTASTGETILIGKNNKQNDYITTKKAQNNHLWFHIKDMPGSHVVILDSEPTDDAIEQAAQYAAGYSSAHMSDNVEVDYTYIKHVHKPSGAKPGFVTYDHQTTVNVTPKILS